MSIPLVRGDVWQFDPRPTSGRAQGLKIRPRVVVSTNALNQGPAELVYLETLPGLLYVRILLVALNAILLVAPTERTLAFLSSCEAKRRVHELARSQDRRLASKRDGRELR